MIRPFLLAVIFALAGCTTRAGIAEEDVPDASNIEAGGSTDGGALDGGSCATRIVSESASRAAAEAACAGDPNCFVCARTAAACTVVYRAYAVGDGCTCATPGACACPADPNADAGACDAGPTDGGGSCTSNADCPAGKVCAYDPGCDSPTRSCHDDTRGDALLVTFCGCDGQDFHGVDGELYAYQPFAHRGQCTVDGGICPADPGSVQTGVRCSSSGATCQGYSPCALTYVDCSCTNGQWDCGSCTADGGNGGPTCGSTTCAANQVCVHPCTGIPLDGGGSPPPYCVDIPTSCNSPSCDCVRPGACPTTGDAGFPGQPTCHENTPGQLYCDGCA